ncbi:flagellar basal body L-ring protein FlgH [Thalassoroseus pseudoceratinae]|uniref:flagellar basal body L-ring protein FlgH n=1 Tax=Thalassoroseus pseudoceratinae TaxID=2713176 RepID=UPI00141E743C|nr:flagellar basal body L-ring protein FlgH [Thalassoroseus pseudoceratinae]
MMTTPIRQKLTAVYVGVSIAIACVGQGATLAQPPQFPPRPPAYDFGDNRPGNQAPYDNRPNYENEYQPNEPNLLNPAPPPPAIDQPRQDQGWYPNGGVPPEQDPYADPYNSGGRSMLPPQSNYPPPNQYAPRGNYPSVNPYQQQRPSGLPPARPIPPPSGYIGFERPLLMQHHSLCFIPQTPPQEIHVHDIVTIIVKEISEVSVDSRFNRSRRGSLLAEIGEFMRISEDGNLTNAAENSPAIDTTLNARLDATGRVLESEEIIYRIAATVVDVLPNGNLVLEARKTIESNDDAWEYTLTGTVRSVDINRDNTALSENIANLKITKNLAGRVKDSTRRAWGVRLLDFIFPF